MFMSWYSIVSSILYWVWFFFSAQYMDDKLLMNTLNVIFLRPLLDFVGLKWYRKLHGIIYIHNLQNQTCI